MSTTPDKADLAASAVEDMLFRLGHLIKEHGVVADETIKDQAEVLAASHLLDFIHRRHGAQYVTRYLLAIGALAEEMLGLNAMKETRH